MSRSKRATPVCGNTTARSEKTDKQLARRRLRRRTRQVVLASADDAVLPIMGDVSDVWTMAKDGKQRFDPKRYPTLMRK